MPRLTVYVPGVFGIIMITSSASEGAPKATQVSNVAAYRSTQYWSAVDSAALVSPVANVQACPPILPVSVCCVTVVVLPVPPPPSPLGPLPQPAASAIPRRQAAGARIWRGSLAKGGRTLNHQPERRT